MKRHQASPPAVRIVPSQAETATQALDRVVQSRTAAAFGNLSPVTLGLAWADWAWHLAASPGRQIELLALAGHLAAQTAALADAGQAGPPAHDDPRFGAADWDHWPFNLWRTSFRNMQAFWREAAQVNGVSEHHRQLVDFFARQILNTVSPANGLLSNPAVLQRTLESGGSNLQAGLVNFIADATQMPTDEDVANRARYVVGGNLAVTPGKVVYRNHLVELIRYAPQTDTVHPEPVFIVPSWIMKYYILDLSPHNSMVRYLVSQGHTVYMVSWRNPDASDHGLSMDDYLELGLLEPLRRVAQQGRGAAIHTVGYCLGGTLLAIAVAALSAAGGIAGYEDVPAPATLTLLAAQVDFMEPGELGLFVDEGQINLLDQVTRGQGFLSGKQMAGSFQFLHSRDLVWARRMREYLMGERDQGNDLMAWNADTTRLPARMHHEYMVALYLQNALANSRYRVAGKAVSLHDLHLPIFLVGTERDHVSPWRSVYKLHRLSSAEITFVLTSGGHNAGIVSEPGHPRRYHHILTQAAGATPPGPDDWLQQAPRSAGSWWPAWQQWLAERSAKPAAAQPLADGQALCDAPGTYVMQRYPE